MRFGGPSPNFFTPVLAIPIESQQQRPLFYRKSELHHTMRGTLSVASVSTGPCSPDHGDMDTKTQTSYASSVYYDPSIASSGYYEPSVASSVYYDEDVQSSGPKNWYGAVERTLFGNILNGLDGMSEDDDSVEYGDETSFEDDSRADTSQLDESVSLNLVQAQEGKLNERFPMPRSSALAPSLSSNHSTSHRRNSYLTFGGREMVPMKGDNAISEATATQKTSRRSLSPYRRASCSEQGAIPFRPPPVPWGRGTHLRPSQPIRSQPWRHDTNFMRHSYVEDSVISDDCDSQSEESLSFMLNSQYYPVPNHYPSSSRKISRTVRRPTLTDNKMKQKYRSGNAPSAAEMKERKEALYNRLRAFTVPEPSDPFSAYESSSMQRFHDTAPIQPFSCASRPSQLISCSQENGMCREAMDDFATEEEENEIIFNTEVEEGPVNESRLWEDGNAWKPGLERSHEAQSSRSIGSNPRSSGFLERAYSDPKSTQFRRSDSRSSEAFSTGRNSRVSLSSAPSPQIVPNSQEIHQVEKTLPSLKQPKHPRSSRFAEFNADTLRAIARSETPRDLGSQSYRQTLTQNSRKSVTKMKPEKVHGVPNGSPRKEAISLTCKLANLGKRASCCTISKAMSVDNEEPNNSICQHTESVAEHDDSTFADEKFHGTPATVPVNAHTGPSKDSIIIANESQQEDMIPASSHPMQLHSISPEIKSFRIIEALPLQSAEKEVATERNVTFSVFSDPQINETPPLCETLQKENPTKSRRLFSSFKRNEGPAKGRKDDASGLDVIERKVERKENGESVNEGKSHPMKRAMRAFSRSVSPRKRRSTSIHNDSDVQHKKKFSTKVSVCARTAMDGKSDTSEKSIQPKIDTTVVAIVHHDDSPIGVPTKPLVSVLRNGTKRANETTFAPKSPQDNQSHHRVGVYERRVKFSKNVEQAIIEHNIHSDTGSVSDTTSSKAQDNLANSVRGCGPYMGGAVESFSFPKLSGVFTHHTLPQAPDVSFVVKSTPDDEISSSLSSRPLLQGSLQSMDHCDAKKESVGDNARTIAERERTRIVPKHGRVDPASKRRRNRSPYKALEKRESEIESDESQAVERIGNLSLESKEAVKKRHLLSFSRKPKSNRRGLAEINTTTTKKEVIDTDESSSTSLTHANVTRQENKCAASHHRLFRLKSRQNKVCILPEATNPGEVAGSKQFSESIEITPIKCKSQRTPTTFMRKMSIFRRKSKITDATKAEGKTQSLYARRRMERLKRSTTNVVELEEGSTDLKDHSESNIGDSCPRLPPVKIMEAEQTSTGRETSNNSAPEPQPEVLILEARRPSARKSEVEDKGIASNNTEDPIEKKDSGITRNRSSETEISELRQIEKELSRQMMEDLLLLAKLEKQQRSLELEETGENTSNMVECLVARLDETMKETSRIRKLRASQRDTNYRSFGTRMIVSERPCHKFDI